MITKKDANHLKKLYKLPKHQIIKHDAPKFFEITEKKPKEQKANIDIILREDDKEKHLIIHISKKNEMFFSAELATSESKSWLELIEENKSFFDYIRRTTR